MYAGKVMEVGATEQIFAAPDPPRTRHALLSAAPVADPRVERARERIVLRGEVPNVLEEPSGLHLPLALPAGGREVRRRAPPLVEHARGRWAACWRAHEAPIHD